MQGLVELWGETNVEIATRIGPTSYVNENGVDEGKYDGVPDEAENEIRVGSDAARRPRLLLIDDEPALARTLKFLLAEAHDVIAVTSGREALTLLLSGEEFDLILCDLMMPQVTGMDIYARVAAERPGLERRLVFMTGGAFTPRAAEFLATVPNARLEKPFTTDAVEKVLHDLLSRSS